MNIERLNYKVDYVFTHTAPIKYEPTEWFLSEIDQSTVNNSTEIWLDSIEDKLDYKKWYCGHYHGYKEIDKIQFMFNDFEELEIERVAR